MKPNQQKSRNKNEQEANHDQEDPEETIDPKETFYIRETMEDWQNVNLTESNYFTRNKKSNRN